MPASPNAPIFHLQLSSRQFWALLGAILGAVGVGYAGLIYVLVGVVYGGIDGRLKSLEDHFQTAIVAGADVKHLLGAAPTLEHKINETHEAIMRLQENHTRMKEQLNSIQSQIHQIPGVRN